MQLRIGVDPPDARLDLGEFGGRHEIGLVEHDDIGEGDLVLGLRRVLQAIDQPFGVGQRHHRVEPRRVLHVGGDEKGLRDGRGVSEAGGLDDDRVESAAPAHQPFDDADQIAAHGAADAAVVHFEDFLVGADDEIVVDADLAELVDDDRVAAAVLFGEDAVQQRRLAGAEIAGDDGDGNFVGQRFSPCAFLPSPTSGRRQATALLSNAQRFCQLFYIMPDHLDIVRRRPFRIGQRVGVERAADLRAGLRGDALGEARIGDVLQKHRRDLFALHRVDDAGDVAGARLRLGGNALRRDEFQPVAGAKIAEGVVGRNDSSTRGRDGLKRRRDFTVERVELGEIGGRIGLV